MPTDSTAATTWIDVCLFTHWKENRRARSEARYHFSGLSEAAAVRKAVANFKAKYPNYVVHFAAVGEVCHYMPELSSETTRFYTAAGRRRARPAKKEAA